LAEILEMWKDQRMRRLLHAMIVVVGIGLSVGLIALGRITADTSAVHARGYEAGRSAGFYSGLRQGEGQGIQEGRALQISQALPAGSQDLARTEFNAGYAAGANDAFGGYDGGWYLSTPYVISLIRGGGPITYRISARTVVQAGVNYYLCADSHTICQGPRR
jgi:hypothetical protein